MLVFPEPHELLEVWAARPLLGTLLAILYVGAAALLLFWPGKAASEVDPSDWRAYLAATEPKPKLPWRERLKRGIVGTNLTLGRRIANIVLVTWAGVGILGTLVAIALHLLRR